MLAGCISFYGTVLDLPFDDESLPKLIDKIVLAQFDFPSFFSTEAKDLISNILTPNPNKRFTLEKIKAHPWLKGPGVTQTTPSAGSLKPSLEKAGSKDLTDLNPDEYIPARMDAFEFASYCTGKLLNGLFELKHISSGKNELEEPPTEMATNVGYKEYLSMVCIYTLVQAKQIYHAMAKTNAKVKVDKTKGCIYAIYNTQSKGAMELIISCQAYRLTDEHSFIVFKKEKVQRCGVTIRETRHPL
eukprot:TRINITY_DN549_c2_g1_i1.p6 TRINITY_DN549_c2_g1~~TRINITY_DN549_c2_g1_i1.p6  ORF type:complete len:244 (+),score=27.49 TRINITY_DN549_c2_g1_i1:780-1511(+)